MRHFPYIQYILNKTQCYFPFQTLFYFELLYFFFFDTNKCVSKIRKQKHTSSCFPKTPRVAHNGNVL